MMTHVKGNLLTYPGLDVICHQANCRNSFGAGIALQIKKTYPEAYAADTLAGKAGKNKLGEISVGHASKEGKIIINIYGQDHYGSGTRRTNYEAIYCGLEKVKAFLQTNQHKTVGFPKNMGSALAGGNWHIIETMITEVFADYQGEVFIVEYAS